MRLVMVALAGWVLAIFIGPVKVLMSEDVATLPNLGLRIY